ncbi:toll-like receptor 2 type-2 [Littorina saxatilis]|uniref:toll-like receptor 2 type-2 n=1 Tax=Littorina saxatilis TaxID=31220 RepID=UPI0038B584E7
MSTIKTDMFGKNSFPALVHLSLESMEPISTIQRFAFRNPSLQTMSLMYCTIPFSDVTIDPDSFAGLPNLKLLQVSHNLGSYIPDEKFNRLFGTLTSLEKLYMGSFGLQSVSKNIFSTLTRLQTLFLYRNKLTEIPDGTFDSFHNLTELNFNDAQIQTIRESTFSQTTRNRLQHVDFSGNPLLCDCDLLWFQDWFLTSPALFQHSYRHYTCSNLPHTLLAAFTLNKQVCFLSREAYQFIIATVTIFIALLSAVAAFYQWRWHIRLLLYESFRGRGEFRRRRRLETGSFDFDVFVSYTKNDLWWVREHLMPELEGRLGLRLCVHERDFLPGNNIVDNIVDCVQSSKKVMMVFSRHFVSSQWCQFELALCLRHVIETDDALIVTCLDDMTSLDVTSTMVAVLKTTTYIQWDECPYAIASFWGRLERALSEIISTDT